MWSDDACWKKRPYVCGFERGGDSIFSYRGNLHRKMGSEYVLMAQIPELLHENITELGLNRSLMSTPPIHGEYGNETELVPGPGWGRQTLN